MSARFDFLDRRLKQRVADHAFRSLRGLAPAGAVESSRLPHPTVNFAANDYLGLAARNALADSLQATRRGAAASPLVCGFTDLHRELCDQLMALEETEAAVLLPSGYAACSGTVATLAAADDLILSDRLNHASLIDGCRLSPATKMIYPHGDVAAVGQLLAQHRNRFAQVWIVTNSVFGMDGDLAPLGPLCDLADQYSARLIVDEAHATGVLGDDGSGAAAELGLKSRLPIRIGTLSKAIGAHGGFVVGPQVVIDYLINFCRPLIFSTAASPLVIAAAIDGVLAIRQQPELRRRVRSHAARVRSHLHEPGAAEVPIVPWVIGSNEAALDAAQQAADAGLFIPAIRPPTVPPGSSRLRISLSAAHSDHDIHRLLLFLAKR